MIDYTKIYLIGINIKRLLSLHILEFKTEVSEQTGLSSKTMIAEYHHCKIIIKENCKDKANPHVIFSGSIHKMWNSLNGITVTCNPDDDCGRNKGFNGNQFTLLDIIEIRTHLEWLFDCKSPQMIFQNIEFGINTVVPFDPKLFLKGLLYHHNKQFEYRFENNFSEAVHTRYILKIYNKSYQYSMLENILRVELKIIKMIELEHFEIKTFADINMITLEKVKLLLLKKFSEVVYYDYTIQKKKFSKLHLEILKNYASSRYWMEEIKPIHRDREKKKLKSWIFDFSENLHQQIITEINRRCVIINRLS